jgi:hypothetical protein
MHQAVGQRRGQNELSPRPSLPILSSFVAQYTPHEAISLYRRTNSVITMYSRMFSFYANDLVTAPHIMCYQHQSLATALLEMITYIRSGPNVGPRLAVLSTIHLEEPRSTALSGARSGPGEGIVRLWDLPSGWVESHLFLSIDPSVNRSSGRFTTQVLLQGISLNSRRNVSPANSCISIR